jgi:hypothetical protein
MGNLPSFPAVGSGYGGGFGDNSTSIFAVVRVSVGGVEGCFGSVDPVPCIDGAGGVPFERLAGESTLFGRLEVGYGGRAGAGGVTA